MVGRRIGMRCFGRLNVFRVQVKLKVEMEVEDSLTGICFTIFDLQQHSMTTEYLTLSVDLSEIPIHILTGGPEVYQKLTRSLH